MWTLEADKAFSKLKIMFTTAPVIGFPNTELQFIVEVKFSNTGIGAVLSQRFQSSPMC